MSAFSLWDGLAALAAAMAVLQLWVARRVLHLESRRPRAASASPPISILKPLCGADEGLWENLASFAAIQYPHFEVLLGVQDIADPAFSIAKAAAQEWPQVMRVVLQKGRLGCNPKVNQLASLTEQAASDLLVVSDSNVRVSPDYLSDLAELWEDPRVGLVANPIAALSASTAASRWEAGWMAASITPGIVASAKLVGAHFVVGKSMSVRKSELPQWGGWHAVCDVLAEDYVSGRLIERELKKTIRWSTRPVVNVVGKKTSGHFLQRMRRWSVMQRFAVGPWVYAAQAMLHPLLWLVLAALFGNQGAALAVCGLSLVLRAELERHFLPKGARWTLFDSAAKDGLALAAWASGFFENTVLWRGIPYRVHPGTRLQRVYPSPVKARFSSSAHLPMQNFEKIASTNSAGAFSPVISPKA